MKFLKMTFASVLIISVFSQTVKAQDVKAETISKTDPEVVLANQGDAILTQKAIDGALSKIPEQHRLMFIRDSVKVDKLVKDMMQTEVFALDAEDHEFSKDPMVQERMRLAARVTLAEAWMEEILLRAPDADYASMAYEDYLANPDSYSIPATLDVTHVLIGNEDRTMEEAVKFADELTVELEKNPGEFDFMVQEYSTDPGKESNFGKYEHMGHGQMVKPFEDAAFALQAEGDISQPVRTEFGYHLIRLDKRHESRVLPFEKVREQAESNLKARHLENYRSRYLQSLLADPIVFPEGSVEIMLRRHFGENLEKAPIFTEDGVQ
jgi:peptidyl-prolyl cis-trans isomerase C